MKETDDQRQNPYAAPATSSNFESAAEVRCSFCGKVGKEAGHLVESPDGKSYICRACARIAADAIENHAPKQIGGVVMLLIVTLGFVFLIFDPIFSSEPQISVGFLLMLALSCLLGAGIACLVGMAINRWTSGRRE
jgi:hypothetical protein